MKLYMWMFLGLFMPQMAWGATANITKVESRRVVIDIGSARGVIVGMKADVLTSAGQIVHPVTGEDYGNRRVKIGEIEIESVKIESAVGRVVAAYGPINVGDIADGLVVIPSEEERMQMDIDEARSEIKSLARSLADEIKGNQKAIDGLRRDLQRVGSSEQRLRQVMNAVQNMRERMVVFENRIANMEQQQKVMIAQDSSEVSVKDQVSEMEQRIKIIETQQKELETLSMKMATMPDTMRGNPDMQQGVPASAGGDNLDALFPEEEEVAEAPWYLAWWFLAIIFAVIGVAVGGAILMLKKKKSQGDAGETVDADMDGSGFEEVETDDLIDEFPDDLPELETADDET